MFDITKENNDGRCAFCDEKKQLDGKITASQLYFAPMSLCCCTECLGMVIGKNLSERVKIDLADIAAFAKGE